jgi:FkbM family methyltransferase
MVTLTTPPSSSQQIEGLISSVYGNKRKLQLKFIGTVVTILTTLLFLSSGSGSDGGVIGRALKTSWTGRHVFVDLGANCGNSYKRLKQDSSNNILAPTEKWEAFLWEANPQMTTFFLDDLAKADPVVTIVSAAASTKDETLEFFLSRGQGIDLKDKTEFGEHGVCDPSSKKNPSGSSSITETAHKVGKESVEVPAQDFAVWLRNLKLNDNDRLVLKIDIEGAEVDLLERMLSADFTDICRADKLFIEWHTHIFPLLSAVRSRHRRFRKDFSRRFAAKCGARPDLTKWH